MNKKTVLLVVLAHPDDESFGMGGTLSLYAQRGVDVHLICATRGEAGGVAPEYMEGFDTIAERRVSELRCAAGILGLAGVHFLDYRDSGMPGSPDNEHPNALVAAPLDEVAAKIVQTIRALQPQVVVTFDPIGGYKHPDHIAIHKATVKAFPLTSDADYITDLPPFSPQKLYYHVISKTLMRFAIRVIPFFRGDPRHYGRNGDIDLVSLVEDGDFPIHAQIDCRSVQKERAAAAACHASQLDGGAPRRGPIHWITRMIGRKENFMRAYPPAEPGLREDDLFAGM